MLSKFSLTEHGCARAERALPAANGSNASIASGRGLAAVWLVEVLPREALPRWQEIFALRALEGPLVKRLRFHDDRWWASSDNDSPVNGSRPLDGDDGIIGRVVWWAHTIVEGEPQPASE